MRYGFSGVQADCILLSLSLSDTDIEHRAQLTTVDADMVHIHTTGNIFMMLK